MDPRPTATNVWSGAGRSIRQLAWMGVLLGGLSLCPIALPAQEPAADEAVEKSAAESKAWQQFYAFRASEFVVEEHGADPATLTLLPTPLQSWTNPIRGDTQHGIVTLWTRAGRPAVIGSIWSALAPRDRQARNLCYEFHSLTEAPVSATLGEQRWWAPQDAGIEWIAIRDIAPPAETRPLRGRQLRDLARELRAVVPTGAEGSAESELRLLPQPVYRYPEHTPGVLDGAIFAFVLATDPELFVMVEALEAAPGNTPRWRVAPARFTGDPLRLLRGKEVLWDQPRWQYERDRIYDFLYGVEQFPEGVPPAVPETSPGPHTSAVRRDS